MFRITNEYGKATDRFDGAVSTDGSVWGTYVHGVFDAAAFRRRILNDLRVRRNWVPLPPTNSSQAVRGLDSLASLIRDHLDLGIFERIVIVFLEVQIQNPACISIRFPIATQWPPPQSHHRRKIRARSAVREIGPHWSATVYPSTSSAVAPGRRSRGVDFASNRDRRIGYCQQSRRELSRLQVVPLCYQW